MHLQCKILQLLYSSSISRQSSAGAFSLGTQFGVGAALLNAANSNFSAEAEIKARKGMIAERAAASLIKSERFSQVTALTQPLAKAKEGGKS